MELVGSGPMPAHFLYTDKLFDPEQPIPLPFDFMQFTLSLLQLLPNNRPLQSLKRPLSPVLSMKPTHRIDLVAEPLEVLVNNSNMLIATGAGAGGGGGGDKPPDGNSGSPDPEPQPDLTLIPDPVQTCLRQKKQLLLILRIKRHWAIMTGQTTLARILSDRIMVIEADLLDLERSDPGTIQLGLVQTWMAENSQELRVYREMVSGKYSGRQTANGKKNSSSRTTKASTTTTTGQTGQTSGPSARNLGAGSTGGNGRGGDDPLKPSAGQDAGHSHVACSKCDKVLNPQELGCVANQTTASALLCNKCLSGIQGYERVRRIREEAESDSSEPAPKKKKGPGRKRNNSTAVAEPPAKKKKPPDTQIPDDPLQKVKANIQYELSQEELEKVQTLLAVFKKKNITVKNTFYKLLGFVDRDSFNGFFDNATALFGHLSENVKNTGMLTGMLHSRKKHIRSFAERSQDELEYLARLDAVTSFSSMNNRKGVPTHEQVKAILGWSEWKHKDGEFNIELFRSFSSMNNGHGVPRHEEVREVLGWPEWKDKDGEFSMELFRAFSSMNHGKGILKHEQVKELLGWPEWKDKDGEFNIELFRAFSSRNHDKGMLKHEQVKEVLGWLEWRNKDGEFSIELFRAFSSMNHGKGILKHEEVKEVLGWPEWKDKDDEFNMELFRAFSSMNSGKGMLKHEEVKEVLGWLEWKDKDGEFNMVLFRAFSSMNHCKGILKHEHVKELLAWSEWKDKHGEFNMELFRAFSSMNGGKGMLKHEEVREVLGWPEWKDRHGEFNMELFRAFSSMSHGKGVLKHEEVKEVLAWSEWKDRDGEFNIELFRSFSSMNNGKGMLKQEKVKEVLDWIDCRGAPNHRLLQIMPRLWASAGLPAIKLLQHWETQLKQLLPAELTGEHSNSDNEGEDKYNHQIKTVALYLSTPKADWSLKWTVLKQFCQFHEQTKTVLMLGSLIGLLSSSGGKSVKRYLQANQLERHFLWRHSMKTVPLRVLNRAMFLCSSDEDRERFVYFAKRLKSLPDKRLWEQYSALLQPLSGVLKFEYMQGLYLEILQPLTKDDQLRFLDASHARVVFDLFPSLSALQKLSKEHSSHWLSKLLEACLQLKTHDITKEGIQILFAALLKTHSLLPWDHDIPDHFLSGMQTTDNNHVEIPVSGLIQSGEQLALSYIVVLMQNLNEMSFTVKGQWLEVEVPGDGVQNYRFPMPQLDIQDEKMAISNWSEEQFRTVLKITGISEHYYLTADQWQKLDNVESRQAEACQPENELEPQKQAFGSLWLKLNQREIFGSEILNLLEEYESEMELMHTVTLLKKAKIDSATHILEEWRQRACNKIEQLKKQDPLLSDVDPDVYQGCQELELLDGCGSIF